MATETPVVRTGSARRRVLRVLLSLVVLGVLGAWAFSAWFVFTFRCDDGCSGDEAEHWRWTGQAVLAASGVLLALAALALGLTDTRRGHRPATTVALVLLVTWVCWLFLGGF